MTQESTHTWRPQSGPLHVSQLAGVPNRSKVVFIHGFAGDEKGWRPLIKKLGTMGEKTCIELPSHGRSPRRRVQDFDHLADQLIETFQDACPQPVHLVGHSLGGALAISLATRLPGRLRSLSLLAPFGLGNSVDHQTLKGLAGADSVGALGRYLRRLPVDPTIFGNALVEIAMMARTDPELRFAQTDMANTLFTGKAQTIDQRNLLKTLKIPTTIIWGKLDRILPFLPDQGIPESIKFHLLDRTGHIPHLECPDQLASILGQHITSSEVLR